MLRPLLKDRKNCYSTLDIETRRDGSVLDVAIFDGKEVHFFSGWPMFLAFLVDHTDEKVFHKFIAHNGGGFDYVSLVDHLNRQTKLKYEVIMSQSKIVVLYIYIGSERIEFVDSSNVLVNASLSNLCDIFKVEHPKQEGVNRSDIENEKRRDPDKYYEYLRFDVVSLYEVCKSFEQYLEIDFFPVTVASLAMYLFRRRFQKYILFKPSDRVDEFISNAYAGGRVEVFRPGEHEDIGVYDINSLYPSVMRDAEYPIGTPVLATTFHNDKIGVYKVKFDQVNRTIPPILWYKNRVNGLEFVYQGEGYFFDSELRLAMENGVKVEIEKGYIWLRSAPLFKEFVDFYYTLRTENKGNALNYICKILLNSLYGKFGQRENKAILMRLSYDEIINASLEDETVIKEYDRSLSLYEVSRPRRVQHRIVNLAAQVTALGRCVLDRAIIENAGKVVYCDTDSIHIPGSLSDDLVTSDLGGWKEETRGFGIYTGRKQYMINDKIRFKGIKTRDTLADGAPLLDRSDIELISKGSQVMKSYSYFPKVKSVIRGKMKSCRIYKTTKIGQRGRYFSNFSPD